MRVACGRVWAGCCCKAQLPRPCSSNNSNLLCFWDLLYSSFGQQDGHDHWLRLLLLLLARCLCVCCLPTPDSIILLGGERRTFHHIRSGWLAQQLDPVGASHLICDPGGSATKQGETPGSPAAVRQNAGVLE